MDFFHVKLFHVFDVNFWIVWVCVYLMQRVFIFLFPTIFIMNDGWNSLKFLVIINIVISFFLYSIILILVFN